MDYEENGKIYHKGLGRLKHSLGKPSWYRGCLYQSREGIKMGGWQVKLLLTKKKTHYNLICDKFHGAFRSQKSVPRRASSDKKQSLRRNLPFS